MLDEEFKLKLKDTLDSLESRLAALEHSVNNVILQSLRDAADEDEAITNLRALENNLMTIMEQNGFIATEQTQELGDEKTAANVSKSLSGGKDITQTMAPNNVPQMELL